MDSLSAELSGKPEWLKQGSKKNSLNKLKTKECHRKECALVANTPVGESWNLKILRFCHWEDNLEIYFKSHKKLIFFNSGITVLAIYPKDVFQNTEELYA